MTIDDLKLGMVYKLYDSNKAGAIVHSLARFDRISKKGNVFTLINLPTEPEVIFTDEDFEHMACAINKFKLKVKKWYHPNAINVVVN